MLKETDDGTVVNTMTYDNYGNILTKNGKIYTYGNAAWKDLLTAYDGQGVTYDAQGNPTTYLGHTLTWEKGRQLKSFDNNTYTYNANGIRTSKTVNGVKHSYVLDGSKILQESFRYGSMVLTPVYDTEDSVCGIVFNNAPYFFMKNLQGDVIGIVNGSGTVVAQYTYDAWGNCTITQDTNGIATINPFRYRGYYLDTETNLYYLQSRYYDPLTGRFVNEDESNCIVTGDRPILCNLYAYGENDPVNTVDAIGRLSWSIIPKFIKFLAELAEDLGDLLIKKYALSPRKYAHKLKYNNASKLIKFVNDNKKKIKKSVKGFSAVADCLEVLILASESFNKIKDYPARDLLKVVATLAFSGMIAILGEIISALVSFILSKVTVILAWAKLIIKTLLDLLIDWILDQPFVTKLESKFVNYVSEASIGSYFVALLQASKAVFA